MRLLHSAQDQSTDANLRLFRVDLAHVKDSLGVVFVKFVAQFVAALRDRSDPAPLPVAHFEDLVHQILGDAIAIATNDSWVLVFDLRFAGFELADCHQRSFQNIDRLEAGDDDRHFVTRRDRLVFAITHHGTNMPGPEKSLHAIERRLQNGGHRRRDKNVRDEHGKILDPL